MRKWKYIAAAVVLGLLSGCSTAGTETEVVETTPEPSVMVQGEVGKSSSYGGMTLTVLSAEDPAFALEDGKKAIFVQVRVENHTEETVRCSYLNNFNLVVDGTFYDADESCSLPGIKEMYLRKGVEALSEDLPPGETCEGYLAFEVDENFQTMEVHYTPKTTDRLSQISVPVTPSDLIALPSGEAESAVPSSNETESAAEAS